MYIIQQNYAITKVNIATTRLKIHALRRLGSILADRKFEVKYTDHIRSVKCVLLLLDSQNGLNAPDSTLDNFNLWLARTLQSSMDYSNTVSGRL